MPPSPDPTPPADRHSDTLYLVDGSGFIFRAFFGVRAPMSAQDGTPTNAVFGFVRLLLNVLKQRQPVHIGVVFDPKGPTFRHERYVPYKANRNEPPPDLIPQFALCRESVDALGLPALEVPRYEADDVIGTLARAWTATGRPCVIVTADKDLMQLVDDDTSLWDGKDKITTREGVIERFGVPPERVVDILGLAGDSSDNIPGVPGIGEKTAAKLINEFGTLEQLLAHAHQVKGKRGQTLAERADDARLSAELATIALDAPIALDERALRLSLPDRDKLTAFLERLNFRQFLKEFGLDQQQLVGAEIDRSRYRLILDPGELQAVVRSIRAAGRLSLDLETTSLSAHDAEIVGFALAWAPGEAVYVPVGHRYAEAPEQISLRDALAALGPLIEDSALPKLGQNVKYEIQVLKMAAGMDYRGVAMDSMLAAYLLDADRPSYKLDDLSLEFLGHRMIPFGEVTRDTAEHFSLVDVKTATHYAAEDADVALRLCDLLGPRLTESGLDRLNTEIELPLARVLAKMELVGIRVDPERLAAQSARLLDRAGELEARIHAIAGESFNVNSPKQLAEVLFDRLGLPTTRNSKRSTDQQVLAQFVHSHEIARLVLDYRHMVKLRGTYLEALPKLIHPVTGRVHSSFRQAVAATGRISSSDPNLQNIPVRTPEGRLIREAFIAEDGWTLLSADYSQVELRLLAHASADEGLIAAFTDGADVHARTAADVFGVPLAEVTPELRRRAKAVNFGLMYGMGEFRLANDLGIAQREARDIIKRYFERYAGVQRYFNEALESARATRRAQTLFGRLRWLHDINSQDHVRKKAAERLAINTPIQGTAADVLKRAMIRLDAALEREGLRTRILLTVHDELVLEVPNDEVEAARTLARAEMEGAAQLRVPLVVEIGVGRSWAEIH